MNITQTTTLLITGLVSIAMILFAMQLKFAKISKTNEDGKLKTSFSIWIGAIFLASTFLFSSMLKTLNDALNIYKSFESPILSSLKTASIYLGLTTVWIIILILINNILVNLIYENRKEKQEMESDNYTYFILKAFLLVGSACALLPAFESLLKMFLPIIQTPFYH